MCGIAGIWRFDDRDADAALVAKLCDRMAHRGPDDHGFVTAGSAGLGMVRLAIIDVQGGQQPIANEAGDVVLICNGEIYNHADLRARLERAGHRFRTHSDVEVILHLYEDRGPEAFQELNGMFAVAIHDCRKNELVLARDRFGQKPLYVWTRGDEILFASEAKAFRAHPEFRVAPTIEAVEGFLAFAYVPAPATLFKDVERLMPGTYWRISADGRCDKSRYWQADYSAYAAKRNGGVGSQQVWTALRDSVERHFMSERPIGVFLSGGIDSASIVACLSELGHRSIQTFTIGFEGFQNNEHERAKAVVNRFKTDHHEITLSPEQYWSALDEVVAYLDDPVAATPGPAIFELSRMAKRFVTVVLSGEGSDELMAGYRGMGQGHMRFAALAALRRMPAGPLVARLASWTGRNPKLADWVRGTDADYLADRPRSMTTVFNDTEIASFRSAAGIAHRAWPVDRLRDYFKSRPSWNGLDLVQGSMIEWWLPDYLLALADRLSMAHSIELRCPFLDNEFADLCLRLTPRDRVGYPWSRFKGKSLLKAAALPQLGVEFVQLPKRGFENPVHGWLRNELAGPARREIEAPNRLADEIIDLPARQRLFEQMLAGDDRATAKVWSLIVLNKWADKWM